MLFSAEEHAKNALGFILVEDDQIPGDWWVRDVVTDDLVDGPMGRHEAEGVAAILAGRAAGQRA